MSKKKGGLGNLLSNPITKALTDVALTATGFPEFIPLANAGESTAGGLAKGKGFGKSLGIGAVSGLESLGGQEAASAVGLGDGNSFVNNALGVDISPSATGLPDIGGGLNDLIHQAGSSVGLSGATDAGGTLDSAASGGSTPFSGSSSTASGAVSAGSGTSGAGGSPFGSGSIDDTLKQLGLSGGSAAAGGAPAAAGGAAADGVGFDKAVASLAGGTGGGASSAASSAGSGVKDFLKSNANLLLPAAAIGSSAVTGNQTPKGLNQLISQAGQTNQIGGQLAGTLESGKLPAGAESMVQQAIGDGEASIKSKYAQMGMSGSTMESQEIQALHERAQGTRFQMASDLTSTGLTALNNSSAIYDKIMQNQLQQDQGLSNAITGLAEATALGNGLSRGS